MMMLVVLSLSAGPFFIDGNYDSDSNNSNCTTNAGICATETAAFVSFKDGFASHDSLIGVHSDYGTSELICPTVDHSSKFETCAANVSPSSEITVRAGRTLPPRPRTPLSLAFFLRSFSRLLRPSHR